MDELAKLKRMLGITAETAEVDEYLIILLEDSAKAVLNYTNRTEVPENLIPIVRELAIMAYNKKGQEGLATYRLGEYSVSFESLFTRKHREQLNNFRLVKKRVVTEQTES